MAFQFLPMPALSAGNSLVDFSGLQRGLQGGLAQYSQGMDAAHKAEMGRNVSNALAQGDYKGAMAATDDPAVALQVGQAQRAQAQEGRAQKQFDADWFGNQALAIQNMPLGPPRDAAWRSFLSKHPDQRSLDPEHLDPRTGPQAVAAEYGKYKDALDQQMKLAQIGHLQSQSAVSAAQLQQLKMATPQYRASVAGQFGLTQGTPEFNAFVLNGTYTPKEAYIHLKDGERLGVPGRDAAGNPTVNIVAGNEKTPPGYRPTQQGNLEAIPGGPADIKISEKRQQDYASMQAMFQQLDELAKQANAVKTHRGLAGNFGLQSWVPNIPGGAAADAKAQLETLKTQAGFGALQEMRNASKTGGALGAISDKENAMLQAALAPLQQSQSFEQAQQSADKIIAHVTAAKARIAAAYNDHWNANGAAAKQVAAPGGQPAIPGRDINTPPVVNSADEARRLPSGTIFMTPDGRTLQVP